MTTQISKPDSITDHTLRVMDDPCNKFRDKVTKYNALASSPLRGGSFDNEEAITDSIDSMKALKAEGGIQEMLVAQMTSIHLLQQTTIALANSTGFVDSKQYYTNSAIKLANCFTQQAALLAKLQGVGGQKIIVEHVEVHHGGQAVVGHVEVTSSEKEKK